jgi:cytochrome c biogenesis factor
VSGYTLTFQKFEVEGIDEQHGAQSQKPITARAVVEVMRDGRKTILKPAYVVSPNETHRIPATMPGDDYVLSVFKIIPDSGSVQLLLSPTSPTDIAAIEVSHKPYINVLWLGGFFMALGRFLAWRRRRALARKTAEVAAEPETAPVPERRRGRVPERRPAPVTASSKQG